MIGEFEMRRETGDGRGGFLLGERKNQPYIALFISMFLGLLFVIGFLL